MVSRRVQPKRLKFDEKAAKAFSRALLSAIDAIRAAKVASPDYMPRGAGVKLDRAIFEVDMVAFVARSKAEELGRQLELPIREPKKKRPKQLRLPVSEP